jgi:outer membrane usher protein
VQANASIDTFPETSEERVRGALTYTDYRFTAQLRDDELYGGTSTGTRRTTGLRLGTALVFADGHLAISRPITDSFIMVVPHSSLKGHDIEVNPAGEKPQAKADFFGPAVVPGVPSYFVRRVIVDVPDVPDGYDLGDQVFNVQPRYRSGTLVTVGSGATAMLEGILVDSAGNPIDLRLGVAVSLDTPDAEPKAFFTDANGEFQLVGLVPGRYELRLDAVPDIAVQFEVPEGISGVYTLGTVRMPMGPDR